MMRIVQYISARVEMFRWFKFNISKSNTQEVRVVAPFGIDAVPIKDMMAILANTKIKGKGVVLGVLNEDPEADEGEVRLYSLNSSGVVQAKIHIKNNGTIEVEATEMNIVADTVNIDGDLVVTGDVDAEGEVSAQAALPATAVSLSTHVHTTSGYGAPTSGPTAGT